MSGHVFVVPGDVRRLACDAWLVPTDSGGSVARGWFGWPPGADDRAIARGLPDVDLRERRVAPIDRAHAGPHGWLGNVVGHGGPEACATQFVRFAGAAAKESRFVTTRSCPLLALPLLGTRYGGQARRAGEVLEALLPILQVEAKQAGVDVALVVYEEAAYAAAQAIRRRDPARWFATPPGAQAGLASLVQTATAGKLVLFLGAGASVGAGLPTWAELVDDLARKAGLGEELEALAKLPLLDRARIVERHFEDRDEDLRAAIAARLLVPHAALVHHLVAALPVLETVTTNYDDLFELAAEGFHPGLSVLPHAPDPGARRWVLKMHGCVTRPADIVLTRDDYLRYEQRRAALAGIVQALLITRHMLFVGFSLADDNFHRIADAVRRALGSDRGGDAAPFGTVLTLAHDHFAESLWQGELTFAPMGDAYASQDPSEIAAERARRARSLEILLDELAARSASTASSLLRPDFAGAMTREDDALADALREFRANLPVAARGSDAYREVEALFARLEATPGAGREERDEATRRRRAGERDR